MKTHWKKTAFFTIIIILIFLTGCPLDTVDYAGIQTTNDSPPNITRVDPATINVGKIILKKGLEFAKKKLLEMGESFLKSEFSFLFDESPAKAVLADLSDESFYRIRNMVKYQINQAILDQNMHTAHYEFLTLYNAIEGRMREYRNEIAVGTDPQEMRPWLEDMNKDIYTLENHWAFNPGFHDLYWLNIADYAMATALMYSISVEMHTQGFRSSLTTITELSAQMHRHLEEMYERVIEYYDSKTSFQIMHYDLSFDDNPQHPYDDIQFYDYSSPRDVVSVYNKFYGPITYYVGGREFRGFYAGYYGAHEDDPYREAVQYYNQRVQGMIDTFGNYEENIATLKELSNPENYSGMFEKDLISYWKFDYIKKIQFESERYYEYHFPSIGRYNNPGKYCVDGQVYQTSGYIPDNIQLPEGIHYDAFQSTDNTYVKVEDSDNLDFGTGNFSIALWIKTTNKNCTLLSKGTSSSRFKMTLEDSKVKFYFGDRQYSPYYGGPQLADNKWHMITLTFDSSAMKMNFYFEGNYHSQTSIYNRISLTNNAPLYICKAVTPGGTDKYTGLMDELRFYTRVLRKEEISGMHYIPGVFKSGITIC